MSSVWKYHLEDGIKNSGTMYKFLYKYIGINVKWYSDEEYLEIINSEEFKEMVIFLKKGLTKIINGIMFVKLEEDTIEP